MKKQLILSQDYYTNMKHLVLIIILFFSCQILKSQSSGKNICDDYDCPSEIFAIQLDEPRVPTPEDNFSEIRTRKFQGAYMAFTALQQKQQQSEEWKAKYDESQLGGKKCLRYYQIQTALGHEYVINEEFRKFVDANRAEGADFIKQGFRGSLKGLNLWTRMKSNCKRELKELDKKPGPKTKDLAQSYKKMGQELGLFDESGKRIKTLEELEEEEEEEKSLANTDSNNQPTPTSKTQPEDTRTPLQKEQDAIQQQRKGKQVKWLKAKNSSLPIGDAKAAEIGGVAEGLEEAKVKGEELAEKLNQLKSSLSAYESQPPALFSDVKKTNRVIGKLSDFKPDIPRPDLQEKLKNLKSSGADLESRAQKADNQAGKITEEFSELLKELEKLEKETVERQKAVDGLNKTREGLVERQAELNKKMENKPKKKLAELHSDMADVAEKANDLGEDCMAENGRKEELMSDLAKLEEAINALGNQLTEEEKVTENISKEYTALKAGTDEAKTEVDKLKSLEEKRKDLLKDLDQLADESTLAKANSDCEESLKKAIAELGNAVEAQNDLKTRIAALSEFDKIVTDISDFETKLEGMKTASDGVKASANILGKIEELKGKNSVLMPRIEAINTRKSEMEAALINVAEMQKKKEGSLNVALAKIAEYRNELTTLTAERNTLRSQVNQATQSAALPTDKVDDFSDRYHVFEEKTNCSGLMEEENSDAEINPEELKKEYQNVVADLEALKAKTPILEDENALDVSRRTEIREAKAQIKEQFGKEVGINPVPLKEWAASFNIKRTFWEATFHPNGEIVNGHQGKYFEVKLKNADKKEKLLFGPGRYFMEKDLFGKNYGLVIYAFVAETVNLVNVADRNKLKLFIQGSADMSGQATFKGNMDSRFKYDEIQMLPKHPESDNYLGKAIPHTIPVTGFTNNDLPNLRGNYLKEMIAVYSKNLKPELLEGTVKRSTNTGDRNATIFLFIPDDIMTEFKN